MIQKKTRLFLLLALLMMSAGTFAQNIRGFYLQDVGTWLGNSTRENEILQYAQGNGFNYILLYDLGDINWNSTTEKNQLAAFMSKAKTQYGILQIGGVVEYSGYVSQKIIPYNTSRSNRNEKFDVVNLEFEFWVTSSITSSYCSKFLSPAGLTCDKSGAWTFAWREFKAIDDLCANNGMISEIYLGWPDLSQMQQIASRADRILLSAYRPTDGDIYLYSKQRMKDIASIGGTTKVITLMSSEASFMGPWLATHPQTRPYQTMKSALDAETLSFKNNIDLQGYHWFTYRYMPKTMLATATITASGPLNFCPGGSVTLTANSGSAYLWNPGGQTTRSITVSNAGSYYVRVTNSGGTSVASSPVTVSTSATGTTPLITASGPISFCPGGNVTLTSDPATSYQWSNGETTQSITVNNSGAYSVTTEEGGCSATSSPVSVDANGGPTVPTITASSALNVCPGTTLVLTSSPSNGYLWSNGSTARSIVVRTPGDYFVKTYSGPNCSAQSTAKTVVMLSAPAVPTVTTSGTTDLDATNTSVVLTSTSANDYEWTNGAGTRAVTVSSPGNYRVTVTDANGCTATSNDVIVSENGCTPPTAPVISFSGANVISAGQSVTLSVSGSGGHLWSDGSSNNSITVTTSGDYTVREYSGGGCFSTSLPVHIIVVNGSVDVSEILAAVNSIPENRNSGFKIYPNPAHGVVNVDFDMEKEKTVTMTLVDVMGREISNAKIKALAGNNLAQIDVTNLQNGIYFVYLIGEGQNRVQKILVE